MAKKIFVDREYLEEQIKDKTDKAYVDEQDNKLSDKVGVLSEDRGYETSKNVEQAHVDTLIKNGKYRLVSGMPCTGTWVVDVTAHSDTWVYQKAHCLYDSQGLGYTDKTIERELMDGAWQPWKNLEDEITALQERNFIKTSAIDQEPKIPAYYKGKMASNGLTQSSKLGISDGSFWSNTFGLCGMQDGDNLNSAEFIITQKNNLYTRVSNDNSNTWISTKQIATTDKIDILHDDMLNGFSIVGGGFSTPKAIKNGNLIALDGVIRISSLPDGQIGIFKLPVGFRPSQTTMSKASTLDGLIRIDIRPDGEVQYVGKILGGNDSQYISLNGIEFEVI